MRKLIPLLTSVAVSCLAAQKYTLNPDLEGALNRISPASLRGNLSFIASDLLAGRATPSKGLDIAAEYIAAQFRKANLEPGGDDEYFQTAKFVVQMQNTDGFTLTLQNGDKGVKVTAADATLRLYRALDLNQIPLFKLDLTNEDQIDKLKPEQLDGKIVLMELSRNAMQRARPAMAKLRAATPALLVTIERTNTGPTASPTQLFDPEDRGRPQTPRLSVRGAAAQLFDDLKPGASESAVGSVHAAAPKESPVLLRNVVGILRGSDPVLKDTCVMVSAHYDHIGEKTSGDGDRIFNGANDDGSGTVSVIELANALASMKERPKRSIVFVTFFGEEKGLLGSRYYAQHPAMPIAGTIADLNLEQVGRTDSTEGEQRENASMTGYDYSNVAQTLKEAGKLTGIKVYENAHASDVFFVASDNVNLADVGVPAHSISVAFQYPDYHGLGDEWQKVDYDNMAKVDRMLAVSLRMFADSADVPHWNTGNSKTERYVKAWKENHLK